MIVTAFALLYYDRRYRYMERRESNYLLNENSRLSLVLQSENTHVWTYDVLTRKYQMLSADGKLDKEYTPLDYLRYFDRDDFEELRNELLLIRDGKKESSNMVLRGPMSTEMRQQRYEVRVSVFQRDEQGVPTVLLGRVRNITYDRARREHERDMLLKYQNVFRTPLVDMVYYDENGIMDDINDHACQTFQVHDKQALINMRHHITQVTYLDEKSLEQMEKTCCTTLLDLKRMEEEGRKAYSVQRDNQLFYEMMLYPIRDEVGDLLGYFLEGRDVTEVVESVKLQKESMKKLEETIAEVKAYTDNINMALQMAECRIMNYLPDRHTLQIISDVNSPEYELSQVRAVDCVAPDFRKDARRLLHQLDRRSLKKVYARLKTIFPDQNGSNLWLTFNGIPMYDAEGHITRYFGMSRNDTRLIMTEERLRAETLKAQEAESLKNWFLLNMSYEIRSPLSNVIGFAEMFDKEHDPADEVIFVNEIKQNSNSLLRLVNDILYISRIDAHMIEPKLEPIDFAGVFEGHCQMGWSSNTTPNIKTLVENPYEHLMVVIDHELLGKVIEQLVTCSIFFTREGMVRGKYEYRQGNLNITIEDTGEGIEQDVLPHLFDRFSHQGGRRHFGSGLELPIVKGLVELMGGSIEMTSDVGKGTTAWVSIPCELISSEKKKEFI